MTMEEEKAKRKAEEEAKQLEIKTPSPGKTEELTKVLADFTTAINEQRETNKTTGETKEEIDKMKADMAKILETQDKDTRAVAERKALQETTKDDTGFGYNVKDIMTCAEIKSMSFNEVLLKPTDNEELKSIQSRASDVYLLAAIIAGKRQVGISEVIPKLKTYQNFMSDTEEVRKAMSIGAADEGFDWIPTGFSADLIDIFHLSLVVANLHPKFTIPAKMTSWTVPGTSTDLKAYRTTVASSDSPTKFRASTRKTRKLTFTPEKLTAATLFDVELEEDSIIPVLPNLKVNIAEALMRATEDTIINGDTSGSMDVTDMHGDSVDGESPSRMWRGYRQFITDHGSVRLDGNGGATFGGMLTVMRNMGKYAVSIRNLAWVTGVNGYFDAFLGLAKVQTIDLYGRNATVLKGELAKFMGIPIIVSEQQRQDLKTTTGVSGGASSGFNDTSAQLVYKPGHALGVKRKITVESAKIPRTDTVEIWATARADFQSIYQTSQGVVSEITNVA